MCFRNTGCFRKCFRVVRHLGLFVWVLSESWRHSRALLFLRYLFGVEYLASCWSHGLSRRSRGKIPWGKQTSLICVLLSMPTSQGFCVPKIGDKNLAIWGQGLQISGLLDLLKCFRICCSTWVCVSRLHYHIFHFVNLSSLLFTSTSANTIILISPWKWPWRRQNDKRRYKNQNLSFFLCLFLCLPCNKRKRITAQT